MLKKTTHACIVLTVCFGFVSVSLAQQGRGAAGNGGNFGGPGMAGATGNGLSEFSAGGAGSNVELPTAGGQRPSAGGSVERPSTDRQPPTSVDRTDGDRFGSGKRPSPPSGAFGERLGALFGGEEGIKNRLSALKDEGMSWAEFGGFGVGAAGDVAPPEGAAGDLGGRWNRAGDLPAAPGAMESIETVVAAQRDAITQATAEAQAAAQAAYDQFWADYYAGVDYAAAAYYEAVAASAEAAYALYMDALNQTTAAIDYYLDYAAEYAVYCYYYPWDCYSYVYDAATGTYTNVETNSDQPMGTITIGEVNVEVAWPSVLTAPESSAEAYEALVVFASNQLGIAVQPLYAGALTEDMIPLIEQYLPAELQAYAALLTQAQTYWGIVAGGVGAVAAGDCTAAAPCMLGDVPAALSSASAGVYALWVGQAPPTDPAGALDLITTVYPALNGLSFSQVIDAETGLAFIATAYGVGVDAEDQPVTAAKLIYAGVLSLEGETVVYAMVAVGEAQIEGFHDLFAVN